MSIREKADLTSLMDELVKQTERLMKMLYAGLDTEDEFRECEETVRRLQVEIRHRQTKRRKRKSKITALPLPTSLRLGLS